MVYSKPYFNFCNEGQIMDGDTPKTPQSDNHCTWRGALKTMRADAQAGFNAVSDDAKVATVLTVGVPLAIAADVAMAGVVGVEAAKEGWQYGREKAGPVGGVVGAAAGAAGGAALGLTAGAFYLAVNNEEKVKEIIGDAATGFQTLGGGAGAVVGAGHAAVNCATAAMTSKAPKQPGP
jgi:hypothetical protein